MQAIRRCFTILGVLTAHPAALLVLIAFGVAWFIFERHSLDWHGAATLATLFMAFLIQRAEHRDTQAIHAKLDELLRADTAAKTDLKGIDKKEPEEIEAIRRAPASAAV